jgi:ribosomal protein L11 methyltransferase
MMYSALTTAPSQAQAEALAEAADDLEPFASGVFEIEDGSGLFEIGLHFEERPDEVALALLAAAHGAAPWAVSEVPDVDWVAKVRRDLPPVEAGRFWLHGSHDAGSAPEGKVPLLIEAAMAFGTGHHGTTLGCLRAVDALEREGFRPARVADIGAGTAALAMAAALAWPEAEVIASDIDPVAVETARANVEANDLARIPCIEADGLDHPDLQGPFDLVLANILKGPLIDLAPGIARITAPGGRIVLSGLLTTQADEIAAAYAREGAAEVGREIIGEWGTLILARA